MNALYFVCLIVGALLIWWSGVKLVIYVDHLAERYKLSKAFIGTTLLGGVTSLPELSLTIVAALLGNGQLAAANLLGGVSIQTAILAVADLIFLKESVTFFSPRPILLVGAVLLIFQLALIIFFISIEKALTFYHFGLGGIINLLVYLAILYLLKKSESRNTWAPTDLPKMPKQVEKKQISPMSLTKLILIISAHSLLVIGGGTAVGYSADKITEIYHLNSVFIGATLVALATSLPEIATTFHAVRIGAFTLAVSNILGSNSLMVGLISLADFFYLKGSLFNELGVKSIFLTSLAILMTSLYLWGMLERRKKTLFRMGFDSMAVLLLQVAGILILYFYF